MNRYPRLTPADLSASLRLIRGDNLGPMTFFRMLSYYGTPQKALVALPELAKRGGKRPVTPASMETVEREIAATLAFGARFLVYGEPDYPEWLLPLEDPPPVLIVRGDIGLLTRECVGVIGTRNASANGWNFARRLASELGEAGITVVSGLARGIDAAAHEGSLATGTVAVIASGIDRVYPPEHAKLTGAIAARGLIVTEQPFGQEPFSHSFPARNRIISGLSRGVVVVEASLKSGTLITARCALEQGREVFAVPGSPFDPRCRGANDLLRQGAVLVESAADVLAVLREEKRIVVPMAEPESPYFDAALSEDAYARILSSLSAAPFAADELIAHTGISPHTAMGVLLELELSGRLQRFPGGKVALVGD